MLKGPLRALILAVVSCGGFADAAPLPPYDMSGHWTGTVVIGGLQTLVLDADLTAVNARKFIGTAVLNQIPCRARGKRRQTTVLRLKCDDNTRAKLVGVLDLGLNAVAGAGRVGKPGRKAAATCAVAKAPAPVCGNGMLETGEQCDDGNTQGADGCGATCAVEPVAELDEVEPNDSPGTSTPVPLLPALVRGSVAAGGDLDFFRITLAGPDLVLETFDANGTGSCAPGTDTVLELWTGNGATILAIDDDGGVGLCSRLELHGLLPGDYLPCVRGIGAVPAYELLIVGR